MPNSSSWGKPSRDMTSMPTLNSSNQANLSLRMILQPMRNSNNRVNLSLVKLNQTMIQVLTFSSNNNKLANHSLDMTPMPMHSNLDNSSSQVKAHPHSTPMLIRCNTEMHRSSTHSLQDNSLVETNNPTHLTPPLRSRDRPQIATKPGLHMFMIPTVNIRIQMLKLGPNTMRRAVLIPKVPSISIVYPA
jgi:predicted protein tyrosine phosphatase